MSNFLIKAKRLARQYEKEFLVEFRIDPELAVMNLKEKLRGQRKLIVTLTMNRIIEIYPEIQP